VSTWQDLVTASLLGTERTAVPLVAVPGVPTPADAPGDPAAILLDRAALLTVARRGGRPAERAEPLPATEPDPAPTVSPAAGRRLARMLGGEPPDLLAEWLTAAVTRGRRAPAYLLPALLDRARRVTPADPELRLLAAKAGGSRARWLAGLNPDWTFVTAHARPGDDAWRLGDAGQRRGYLTALRAHDPGAARELIAGNWDAAGPDERVMFVNVMAGGLSLADEPLLEAALDDRSAWVRKMAADVLAALPGSALAQRMAERAGRCLRLDRGIRGTRLFRSPGQPVERWLAKAAAVLRDEGIPASSAHVIESVRLAEALAALRGRPLAGLEEVTEAARSVLCEGSDLLTALIQRRLVVGERLGTVPPATPMVPLQRDLQDQQRHLRLRPGAEPRDYDLDLRKPNDLARSRLLYRLALLDVAWGTPLQGRTPNIGTFRESWQLTWRPELDLALIEASMWGSTVAAAAAQRARSIAAGATALDELTALTERCLLADLGDALPAVLAAVRDRAALEVDVTHLMAALPALVRAARYGDVRGTDPARLGEVAVEMITRVCAGLPAAVASLDETAEQAMRERIDAVNSATGLLADGACRDRWLDTLAVLARGDDPPDPPAWAWAPGARR